MDKTAQTFWCACQRGEFSYQRCDRCSNLQNYPRPFCVKCGSEAVSFVPSQGLGRIYSITKVIRALTPEFQPLVPYSIALVDLDEGVRVMAHAANGLRIDDRVKMTFLEHQGRSLPLFEPE